MIDIRGSLPPKISKKKKDVLSYLSSINAIKEQYHYFYRNLLGRKSTRSLTTNKLSLRLAFDCPPKISKKKKDGLLFLCNTNEIKEQYHHIYRSLPSNP
nr:unnamed protein product [Callosobruchus analis]